MTALPLNHGSGPADGRILASASSLFARLGYNGVSTREIAIEAGVNEVTIYRHYRRKRDLYCAVLESELKKVQLRGDLLSGLAEAADGHAAICRAYELVASMLPQNSDLMRLLQFSMLEQNTDFTPLLRKYLSEFVEVIARYLDPWMHSGELGASDSRALVVTIALIVCSGESFARIFAYNSKAQQRIFCDFAGALRMQGGPGKDYVPMPVSESERPSSVQRGLSKQLNMPDGSGS